MGQNPGLLLHAAFSNVNEQHLAELAKATAELARAAFTQQRSPASGLRITLQGELGAGKTTFARYFLQTLGVTGRIKSPSFSVVESYASDGLELHHFDFYRQSDHAAWQGGGLRDLIAQPAITLIEWPQHAQGLPAAHIAVHLRWPDTSLADAARDIELSFFDRGDGIAFAPHLQRWQTQTAKIRSDRVHLPSDHA